jgi:hypothetical protein
MNDKLTRTLKAVGKATEVFTSPDGTEVLLLPYGGRVLGLFSPGSSENFYWTNPALDTESTARAYYACDDWHNSGGDRTWLAPEVDVFLPNYPRLDKYFQPRQLDPGDYQVQPRDGRPWLVNRLTLTLSRSGKEVVLEMAKSVAPAANPLRHERGWDWADLEYAGYTQFNSLALLRSPTEACVGLWNLIQMPHKGELLVPTFSRSQPRLIMGAIPEEDLLVGDRLVRYKMRQTGEHKISLRAVGATGRVAYLYERGGKWSLIVRNFVVNPSGEYIDVPWNDPEHLGYSTQACNVNSRLGEFSELEYHIPAIGRGTGLARCDDTSQVWAFRGDKERIVSVARCLVSPEV